VFESFVIALGGQLPVKLALSAVIMASFLSLRGRETEGAMGRYALLGAFLACRDILFALFPLVELYRASDLFLFAALLYLRARPLGSRRSLWAPLGISMGAGAALALGSAFGFLGPTASSLLWGLSLVPIAASAIALLAHKSAADTPERALGLRSWIPLGLGSLAYLAAEAALGPGNPIFQGLVAPLFYGLILSLAFIFVDLSIGQLVRAVDYYEESIDSLYDLLLAAGAAMKPDFSLQDVLDNMVRVLVERSGADGGILALADEFEDSVSVRALHGSYPPPFKLPESLPRDKERVEAFVRRARFKLGEGILGEAARSGKHLFLPKGGDSLPDNGEEDWLKPGGLIVVPLVVNERIIGAVSLAKAAPGFFVERDFERCKLLADFGSISIANSFTFLEAAERGDIEREAEIAADVQRALAPKKFPELPGVSFGSFSNPAKGVCSDYYDAIQTKADKAVIAIGDVAGKGVAASLVMVMIRSILHLITASAKDAATLLQWVNRGVSGKVDLDHYATLGLVVADAGKGELEFANAGHQPLIIYRADADAIETVDSKSVPIGVERTSVFEARRVAFRPGDVLVMYTDGVVEAMNEQGKQFGRKNLGNAVQRSHAQPAAEIAAGIRDDLASFAGRARQHDDQTVLVMKARGR
jgi:sigma-B regulation protein RsbU (phosphoserine phosphatase)